MLKENSKIFVAGHNGMVGSAIKAELEDRGYSNIVTRERSDLDLLDQMKVNRFFDEEKPEYVVVGAAKVGGIHANDSLPAEFIYENLLVECNLIHASWLNGCKDLLFLGSSCIYPVGIPQPMHESALLTAPLEPTNEPYAIAKIAGIKLCESYNRQYGCRYRSGMPTNLYGPNDNFHPENSHVIPALMQRIHQAKINGDEYVSIWGSGKPRREFLHVNDMASACVHVMTLPDSTYLEHTNPRLSHINVGFGDDVSIEELALTLASVIGYEGRIEFDSTKPDGAPRKLLDTTLLQQTGWLPEIGLEAGLKSTYTWFCQNIEDIRR